MLEWTALGRPAALLAVCLSLWLGPASLTRAQFAPTAYSDPPYQVPDGTYYEPEWSGPSDWYDTPGVDDYYGDDYGDDYYGRRAYDADYYYDPAAEYYDEFYGEDFYQEYYLGDNVDPYFYTRDWYDNRGIFNRWY